MSKYPQQNPMLSSTSGATFLLSSQNGQFFILALVLQLLTFHSGLYLKENGWFFLFAVQIPLVAYSLSRTATEVPGVFNISGSIRRMRELQAAFESPPCVSPKRLVYHPSRSYILRPFSTVNPSTGRKNFPIPPTT